MGSCSVEGCISQAISRGLCDKHRKRIARHGNLEQGRPDDWGKRVPHPLYGLWDSLNRRCRVPTHKDYANYGARGIYVCERWADFWSFVADMGPRPSARHSVDRIDNSGPYDPKNCRWATPAEQSRNQRSSVITESLAREIKRRQALGETTGDIARAMRLGYDNVRNVVVGSSWGDLAT